MAPPHSGDLGKVLAPLCLASLSLNKGRKRTRVAAPVRSEPTRQAGGASAGVGGFLPRLLRTREPSGSAPEARAGLAGRWRGGPALGPDLGGRVTRGTGARGAGRLGPGPPRDEPAAVRAQLEGVAGEAGGGWGRPGTTASLCPEPWPHLLPGLGLGSGAALDVPVGASLAVPGAQRPLQSPTSPTGDEGTQPFPLRGSSGLRGPPSRPRVVPVQVLIPRPGSVPPVPVASQLSPQKHEVSVTAPGTQTS